MHRTIRYEHLSDVAYVGITQRPDGTVAWYLHGKYIGGSAGFSPQHDVAPLKRRWWQLWRG
jgi:hypothetical protein